MDVDDVVVVAVGDVIALADLLALPWLEDAAAVATVAGTGTSETSNSLLTRRTMNWTTPEAFWSV